MNGMHDVLAPWSVAYLGATFAMWAAMMALMMLPSIAPVLVAVSQGSRARTAAGGAATPWWWFLAGYFSCWLPFSVVVTLLQAALRNAGWLSADLVLGKPLLASGLLIAVGAYQWSPFKLRALMHCRSPLGRLLHDAGDGPWGALAAGVTHGLFCLSCCWALMLVLFVVGVMNLLWVIAIAAYVAIERWAGTPRWLPRLVGGVLCVAGLVLLAVG